jgi:hypothetical protein
MYDTRKFCVIAILFAIIVGSVFADGNASRIRQIITQCEKELGVHIEITQSSDYRTLRRQAELMAGMSDSQLGMYQDGGAYTDQIKAIPRNHPGRVEEIESILKKARGEGRRISYHLTGDAVDISGSTPSNVRDWLTKHNVSILNEVSEYGNNCYHLQLK